MVGGMHVSCERIPQINYDEETDEEFDFDVDFREVRPSHR